MKIDRVKLEDVHARLVVDPSAVADLFEVVYQGMIGYALWKHRRYNLTEDEAKDIAVKIIATLSRRPSIFDPARGKSLLSFLFMMVDRAAINANNKLSTRSEIFSKHTVEVRDVGGTFYETDHATGIDARMIIREHSAEIIKDPGDDVVLALLLDNEHKTDVYAERLKIGHLEEGVRTAEVKRRKDRIEQRLRRLGKKL